MINAINGAIEKTTYSQIAKITGLNEKTIRAYKHKKIKISSLNSFIVEMNISRKEKLALLNEYKPKVELWKEIKLKDHNIKTNNKRRYFVSDLGRTKFIDEKGVVHLKLQSTGNLKYSSINNLYKAGPMYIRISGQKINVHTLVSHYFLGPKKNGYVIYHKDGNKCNNEATNLEYITTDNLYKKMVELSTIKNSIPICKINAETNETIDFYSSIKEAARENYLSEKGIRNALKDNTNTYHGFKWAIDNEFLHKNITLKGQA